MKYVGSFLIAFTLVYLAYLFFVILRKDKLKNFKNNAFLRYLVRVYNLDVNKLDMRKMANIIALANSFIIAMTFEAIVFVSNFFLALVLAFAILIVLQIVIYHIIGTILKRRCKNV